MNLTENKLPWPEMDQVNEPQDHSPPDERPQHLTAVPPLAETRPIAELCGDIVRIFVVKQGKMEYLGINDTRVAGPKLWNGVVIAHFNVRRDELLKAIGPCPP